MEEENCCCCIPLKIGVGILSVLQALGGGLVLASAIYQHYEIDHLFKLSNLPSEASAELVTGYVVGAGGILFGLLLLFAVCCESPCMMIPWIIWSVISIMASFANAVAQGVKLSGNQTVTTWAIIVIVGAYLLWILLMVYILIKVYTLYKLMRQESGIYPME